jgi:hypothetical protein
MKSENKTEGVNGSRSFEERVFARFDAIDSRFDAVEVRIERLEMKQLDTRPIWERALVAIEETNANMQNGFAAIDARFDAIDLRFVGVDARFDGMDQRFTSVDARLDGMDQRFTSVDARLDELSTQLDDGIRGVERKMDVLNQYFLDLRADQRYVDRRLEKIESQSKPS